MADLSIKDILAQIGNISSDSSSYDEFMRGLNDWFASNKKRSVDSSFLNDLAGKQIDNIYALQQLNEQRAYDSPSALLERLMRAGMSRDAALAVIGSSGGSGGSGGSPLIGASAPLVPSESELREAQKNAVYTNIAITGLNTLANLAQVGAQIPIYMQTEQGLAYQNEIQKNILDAQNIVNNAHDVIKQAIDAGVVSGSVSEFTGSKDNLQKVLNGLADKGFQPAVDFVSGDNMKLLRSNQYANQIASQEKTNMLQADQYMRDCFNNNRAAETLNDLNRINIDLVTADIEKTYSEIENLHYDNMLKVSESLLADFNVQRGNALLPLEKKNLKSQSYLNYTQSKVNLKNLMVLGSLANMYNSQSRLNAASAESLESQNKLTNYSLFTPFKMPDGTVSTGARLQVRSGLYDLFYHTKELTSVYSNKDWFDKHLQTMFNNQDALYSFSVINSIYAGRLSSYYSTVDKDGGINGDVLKYMRTLNWFYGNLSYPMSGVQSLTPFQNESSPFNYNNIPSYIRLGGKLLKHF